MSIEPEVPYGFHDEGSEDDLDTSWRDLTISSISNKPSQRENRRPADDSWMLPVREISDILGKGTSRIREIEKNTGARIEFNHDKQQIDIWGDDSKSIANAKAYLDSINTKLQEEIARNTRKVLGWERPQRELTGKERARFEKKQARLEQEKTYQKLSVVSQPYNACFPLPDGDAVPMNCLLGENERYLNKIRVECKAYVWFNQNTRQFQIAGETEECVHMAAVHVRNWYLKCSRKIKPETILIMKQPKENCKIKFRKAPNKLILSNNISDKISESKNIYLCYRIKSTLEPVPPPASTIVDLFTLAGGDVGRIEPLLHLIPENLRKMDQENQSRIERILEDGLESVRLLDGEIRMKIRFGQLAFSNVSFGESTSYSIEKINENLFRKDELVSIMQPYLASEKSQLDGLFKYLSQHGENLSAEPETSVSIYGKQRSPNTGSSPPRNSKKKEPIVNDIFATITTAKFTPEGHVSLWNCIMNENQDVTSIKSIDLESKYAWNLRLQYAHRLLSKPDSPHGRFVSKLRLRDTNRLVMVVDDKTYRPTVVVQKTKWIYGWKNNYIVEICKDEIWNMSTIAIKHKDLPVDLSTFDPHRVMFKVSLTKVPWRDRFSQNINLSIGEAPHWTIGSFLATADENVKSLMEAAKEFSDIISTTVPVFWEL
ncbi:hypothetical protein K501DRAFT_326063 [Backusella circina FSU 941]|nr:hypothetical protein K501DRAFT_326063 [Backusella circina FSU 941]